jgi:sugar O-acyltransferase (sialic acid O-acetyltransferase NeuD family)
MSCAMEIKPIPTIVVGAGGHGKVVLYVLSRLPEYQVLGYVDSRDYGEILGFPRLGDDSILPELAKQSGIAAVIGVGKVRAGSIRATVFSRLSSLGFALPAIVAPTAIVAPDVSLGEGSVVMDRAIIQPGCQIGNIAIINTGAIVDHDCVLGDNVHVSSGACLSGAVRVGKGSLIGVGASLIQLVQVGEDCTIGGGASVVSDCLEPGTYVGVPAKKVAK